MNPTDAEAICQECGGPNIVWFAHSDLWNAHAALPEILCPICFARRAETNGTVPSAWLLSPETPGLLLAALGAERTGMTETLVDTRTGAEAEYVMYLVPADVVADQTTEAR